MRYKFLNVNPLGKREEDCVCRAITLATNKKYKEIEHKLHLVSDLFDCKYLCVCCYKYLLDNVFGFERIEEYKGMYIGEFLQKNEKGTYLIRIDGHLTCAIDGIVYDIWNCTKEQIDIIWCVK